MAEYGTPQEDTSTTFAEQVNLAIKQATTDSRGKVQYPEGTDASVIYTAGLEKRRRDAQRAYTKANQERIQLAGQNSELEAQLGQHLTPVLSQEQRAELAELKETDVDKWHTLSNIYENRAKNELLADSKEKIAKNASVHSKAAAIKTRNEEVTAYLAEHPELNLSGNALTHGVPKGIFDKVFDPNETFEEAINEAADFIKKGTAIHTGEKLMNQPNLGNYSGSDMPESAATRGAKHIPYKQRRY